MPLPQKILDRIDRINAQALRKRDGFAPQSSSPLDEFLANEARMEEEQRHDGTLLPEERAMERRATLERFLEFLYREGPHPGHVAGRLYAVTMAVRPDLLGNLSARLIGRLLGLTKAAICWRAEQVYNRTILKAGGHETRAGFQKSARGNNLGRQVITTPRYRELAARLGELDEFLAREVRGPIARRMRIERADVAEEMRCIRAGEKFTVTRTYAPTADEPILAAE